LLTPFFVFAVSSEYAYRAVDPIIPINQLQLENDYSPLNANAQGMSNILYLKPLFKIPPNHFVPVFQGIRFEFQVVSAPKSSISKEVTSLGDTQFFDLFLWAGKGWEVGIGPMAIFPTALTTSTGQGKWQLGPAFGFLLQLSQTQFGLLAQNPISFAGDSHRANQNYLLFQPLLFHHLKKGWYLKSNPQWTFDWLHHNNKLPLNFGVGRVFTVGRQPFNIDLVAEAMTYRTGGGFIPEFTIQFLFSILFEGEEG
jgi:hypothetical protein